MFDPRRLDTEALDRNIAARRAVSAAYAAGEISFAERCEMLAPLRRENRAIYAAATE